MAHMRTAYLTFFGLLVAFIYFAVHVVAQMLRDASAQTTPAETGPMKFIGPGDFVGFMWVVLRCLEQAQVSFLCHASRITKSTCQESKESPTLLRMVSGTFSTRGSSSQTGMPLTMSRHF